MSVLPRVCLACLLVMGCAGAIPEAPSRLTTTLETPSRTSADGPDDSPRRGLEVRLQGLPLPPVPRSHPRVGRLTGQGSLAIGTTRDGFVVDCRPLPLEGPHHRVLSVQSRRGTNCGTDELVAALLRAAEKVAKRHPGSILPLGNLSRHGGGDIPWSISHNAGRDADIGFYLLGPDDQPIILDDFVRLDASGRAEVAGAPVRLDVRRTWELVRALLTNPDIEVQWLFVSRPIREMLLEHARRRGETPALLAKAAEALAQPRRALPHDDHLHLRVYCAPDDLYEGCRDAGSDRSWHVARPDRVEARVRELKALLGSRSRETRIAAMTVLGRMGRREVLPLFVRALEDRDAGVRLAAANILREMGVAGVEDSIVRVVARGNDAAILPVLLDALNRTLPRVTRVNALARLLDVGHEFILNFDVFEIRTTVADWALEEIEASPPIAAVPVLVQALRRPGVDRDAIHRTLVRLTAADLPSATGPALASVWEGWWRTHRRQTPQDWYLEAFRRTGMLKDGDAGIKTAEILAGMVEVTDDTGRRAAWTLLRRTASRLWPGWKQPWPADSIEPWGVLARTLAGRLLAEITRTTDGVEP